MLMQAVGMPGFRAGASSHIVDSLALCDPLLSRLPAVDLDRKWMAAHLARHVPTGYLETLRTGQNRIGMMSPVDQIVARCVSPGGAKTEGIM